MSKALDLGAVTAYALAVKNGFTGTEAEWLASLKGADGVSPTAENIASALGYTPAKQADVDTLNQNLIAPNAGAHNSIYRGKYLGTTVTAAQYAAISAGTFEDLYIGDYWTIGGVNYRIAAFDYYWNCGDNAIPPHHAVIVPEKNLYNAVMNDTDATTGGYYGSKMYTTGLTQAKTTINTAFGAAHVLNHRQFLTNAVSNGRPSNGSWCDSTVELMTEQNVYGGKVFGTACDGTNVPALYTIDKSQYPLFAMNPAMLNTRETYWLRDVITAAAFAHVATDGSAGGNSASAACGVRPAFSIKS